MKLKIDHVNMSVADLDESVQWYGKVFGFEAVESGRNQAGIRWAIVANNDSMICMWEHKKKQMAERNYEQSYHLINHFGLRVSNADEWRTVVRENDLKLYYGGEIEYPHSRSWYIHDPSGHEIEVSCTNGKAMEFPEHR